MRCCGFNSIRIHTGISGLPGEEHCSICSHSETSATLKHWSRTNHNGSEEALQKQSQRVNISWCRYKYLMLSGNSWADVKHECKEALSIIILPVGFFWSFHFYGIAVWLLLTREMGLVVQFFRMLSSWGISEINLFLLCLVYESLQVLLFWFGFEMFGDHSNIK